MSDHTILETVFNVGPHIIRTLVVVVLFLDGFSCDVKICF